MSDIAIEVNNVWKKFRKGEIHDSLRDLIPSLTKRWFGGNHNPSKLGESDFWALRDVSFKVRQGEVLGIIGSNGAGKSTMLRLLSRILKPNMGHIKVNGRLTALIEVGAGFHQDLTGRENIYLNGAILGMKKQEIDKIFDEIVAFSGLEEFIDTPVKRYSSGMNSRLGFAVAAHVDPEILLVDEVLAVGDVRFQQKCLRKMHEVGSQGRTVIFVSHNMSAVTRLCGRAILLDEARVFQEGPSRDVVSAYLNSEFPTVAAREWPDTKTAPAGEAARLCAVRVRNVVGCVKDVFDHSETIGVDMEYEVKTAGEVLVPTFRFLNDDNVCLFSTQDFEATSRQTTLSAGRYISTVWIPGNFLAEGRTFVDAALWSPRQPTTAQFNESQVVAFQVAGPESNVNDWRRVMGGVLKPTLRWTTRSSPNGGGAICPEEDPL